MTSSSTPFQLTARRDGRTRARRRWWSRTSPAPPNRPDCKETLMYLVFWIQLLLITSIPFHRTFVFRVSPRLQVLTRDVPLFIGTLRYQVPTLPLILGSRFRIRPSVPTCSGGCPRCCLCPPPGRSRTEGPPTPCPLACSRANESLGLTIVNWEMNMVI